MNVDRVFHDGTVRCCAAGFGFVAMDRDRKACVFSCIAPGPGSSCFRSRLAGYRATFSQKPRTSNSRNKIVKMGLGAHWPR
jgi:hypothetical protein